MSENYQFYVAKMAQVRADRFANRPLQGQLDELLAFVKSCEEQWIRDSREEPSTGR